ncbi:SPX domain-containing protein [Apiospora aurea]|uniref:SPX domain-containing protein n=1 Tax=Apiospora aurea TaxID=335848 RepID=A0ABR1QA32_9PEZI
MWHKQTHKRTSTVSSSSSSPPLATDTDADADADDSYELDTIVVLSQQEKDREAREARRKAKRDEKRRWLDERDEMKFSHSIQFNAVPDWSSHYIAYSNLKKLIYSLEKSIPQQGNDVETRPLLREDDPQTIFSRALDVELEKITSFFQIKEKEIFEDVEGLLRDLRDENGGGATIKNMSRSDADNIRNLANNRRPSRGARSTEDGHGDSDSDEDDETAALNKRPTSSQHGGRRRSIPSAMHASTDLGASTDMGRSTRRTSIAGGFTDYAEIEEMYTSSIMLKKRIIGLYVQLCELKSYVQLNHTGFRKILKKFDKIVDLDLRSKYMAGTVEPAYPFRAETMAQLDDYINRLEQAFADCATQGDLELAKRDLRSHLREHVVWERNTVWRELIGLERRAEAASLGHGLLGGVSESQSRLQGDDPPMSPTKEFNTPIGRFNVPTWVYGKPVITLLIVIAIFIILLYVPFMASPEQQNCAAMLAFVSLLWATEAIPLFVTALLIPFLAVVLNIPRSDDESHRRLDSKEATAYIFAAMWTPVIMLLLGGFTVAAAVSKMSIDKRVATFVLAKAGTRPRTVLVVNMFVAGFASMWVSNVAAPVLCFSILEPILRNLPQGSNMAKAIIIGIALASNIGEHHCARQHDPQPSWGTWFFVVIPVGTVSLLCIWMLLLVTFNPGKGCTIMPVRVVREKFTAKQWFTVATCIATIFLWCASHSLESTFGDMGVIAILPIVVFFGTGILSKDDFNNFPWTIIILAAGGLSLGKSVKSSGLLHTVAVDISRRVAGLELYAIVLTFASLTMVFATFISHSVAAFIILPLVAEIGRGLDEPHPNLLVMTCALMCSGAMALPTTSFPNITAIMKEDATGQRYLTVNHFISRGIPASIMTLGVVVTLGYGAMHVMGM